MDFSEAFADDVTLEQFFEEILPRLHNDRIETFRELSEIPVIVSVYLRDTKQRWTVELRRDGLTVEADEMVDFPMVTIEGDSRYWDEVKRHARTILRAVDARRDEVREQLQLTPELFADFERFDTVIDVEITETEDNPSIALRLVLNNYEPVDGARSFCVALPLPTLLELARGEKDPKQVAKGLSIRGDAKAAVSLGGLFASRFEG